MNKHFLYLLFYISKSKINKQIESIFTTYKEENIKKRNKVKQKKKIINKIF